MCIRDRYRTVRGAALLPARVLECRRASSTSNSRGAGGYRYLVELYANGRRLELETNDAFWFRHDKDKGKVLQVWYNPNARCAVSYTHLSAGVRVVAVPDGAAAGVLLDNYLQTGNTGSLDSYLSVLPADRRDSARTLWEHVRTRYPGVFHAAGLGADARNATAVSYTHLDVYKRQPLSYQLCSRHRCQANHPQA